MKAKGGYVYIVSNKGRTVFYVGVTSNLYRRIYDHRTGCGSVFTTRYACTDLLYYQFFDDIRDAIHREKRLKKWNRKWKDELIATFNPENVDLYPDLPDGL